MQLQGFDKFLYGFGHLSSSIPEDLSHLLLQRTSEICELFGLGPFVIIRAILKVHHDDMKVSKEPVPSYFGGFRICFGCALAWISSSDEDDERSDSDFDLRLGLVLRSWVFVHGVFTSVCEGRLSLCLSVFSILDHLSLLWGSSFTERLPRWSVSLSLRLGKALKAPCLSLLFSLSIL